MDFTTFAFWLLCGLITVGLMVLGFFLQGILAELKRINDGLIHVVTNQEWHYREILSLKDDVEKLKEYVK